MTKEATLQLPADTAYLKMIGEFVSRMAKISGFDDLDCKRIEVAVDEACTNVIEHTQRGASHDAFSICCRAVASGIEITISDRGAPFDFDSVAVPDVSAGAEDRPIGGLGIFLMKKFMDFVKYTPGADGMRHLTMSKNRPAG
ncbi:MAG: ATP-binding protein [Candidatus Tectomicrobia bacterium]|nr:ATP-binding protein [Candidatus Tectomicrobia bacterium]